MKLQIQLKIRVKEKAESDIESDDFLGKIFGE